MKKTIPLLALGFLLSFSASPTVKQKVSTDSLLRVFEKELAFDQRLKNLEQEQVDNRTNQKDIFDHIEKDIQDRESMLDRWSTILGLLTGLIGLVGLIIPYILFAKSKETKDEVDKILSDAKKERAENLQSIRNMKRRMRIEHENVISENRTKVERMTEFLDRLKNRTDSLARMDANLDNHEVKSVLDEINKIDPRYITSLEKILKKALGSYYYGRFEASIEAWKEMLGEQGVNSVLLGRIYHFIGLSYVQLADSNKLVKNKFQNLAILYFQGALSHQPEDIWARFYYALTLSELNRLQEAVNEYTTLLLYTSEHSISAWVFINRGIIRKQLGQHDAAMMDYTKSISINPLDSDVYINRGNLRRDMQDLDGSLEDYSRAIELNDADPLIYNGRCYTWIALKKYDDAISDIKRALELDREDANFYDSLGDVYLAMEDWQKAYDQFNIAIEKGLEKPFAYHNRAKALLKLGKEAEAAADEAKAAELEAQQKPDSQN